MWQVAEHDKLSAALDDCVVLVDLGLDRRVRAGELFEGFFLQSVAFADVKSLFHGFDRVRVEGGHDEGRSRLGWRW